MSRAYIKSLFNKQKAERIVKPGSLHPSILYGEGIFAPSWEAMPLPDPGAMNYVYQGLTQQPYSIYGRGGQPFRHPLRVTSPPKVALGTQVRQGLGIAQGTFYLQPLYDPTNGTGGN